MDVVERYFPNWHELTIHETSPADRGASARLREGCELYMGTQFWSDAPTGSFVDGVRCENIEALTFSDNSIDLHISQDVLEHIFDPYSAFREIARTLRPGGAHICTVPMVQKEKPSKRRARIGLDGIVQNLVAAQYHGNPISSQGALVTIDWGYDICWHILNASHLATHVVQIDDLSKGIRAEYIEVLVCFKSSGEMNERV